MDTLSEEMSWLHMGLPEPDPDIAHHLHRRFIRGHVIKAYAHAIEEPAFATPRLSKWFRRTKQLGSKDRRRVSDVVYDLIRHGQVLSRFGAESTVEMLDAWIAFHEGSPLHTTKDRPEKDFADALGLPVRIAQQWMKRWDKKDCSALGKAINQRPSTYIRANAARCDEVSIGTELATENISVRAVPQLPGALELLGRGNLVGSTAFKEGKIEIQDISSQRFCQALSAKPGMVIWDMCAGAGGKTLALAAMGAQVHATDPRSKALDSLIKRAKRSGASVRLNPPKKADLVLVDAPCSGLGRLHRDPALRWRLMEQDPWQHLKTQEQLIEKAIKALQSGGRIAYATCSLLEEENAHAIPGEIMDERWLWPHQDRGDGFYWRIVKV